jgi:hypothetical protein
MNLQGIFVMFAHHFRANTSHFRTQYAARTPSCGCLVPSWVPGTIMGAWYHHGWLVPSWVAGLKDKKRVAQKWSNSLSELLRRLMSYLLADGSN